MISLDLATRLKAAGLPWQPSRGDRFKIPDRDLDEAVFVISDMVVEVHELPQRAGVLRFNGTTEWALDSIETHEVVWLPYEHQLRTVLGEAFVALEATPGGFIVVVEHRGERQRHIDIDAESAYARAALAVFSS